MRFILLALVFAFFACGSEKTKGKSNDFRAVFMPENHLYLEDDSSKQVNANGVDEAYFNDVIARAQAIYEPIVANHGGELVIEGNWEDSTVNAYADRQGNGNIWKVQMFGGMARRNEITKEGFALVICHELGHHLAGYPKYAGQWAANEGNSDFYATASCAAKLFIADEPAPEPEPQKTPCQGAKPCKKVLSMDKDACQRAIDGALSLGKLLAVLGGERVPSLSTPDKSVVRKTQDSHPKAQCRLDTMYMGIMCNKEWDDSIIPRDKAQMAQVSCAARPACWYKP